MMPTHAAAIRPRVSGNQARHIKIGCGMSTPRLRPGVVQLSRASWHSNCRLRSLSHPPRVERDAPKGQHDVKPEKQGQRVAEARRAEYVHADADDLRADQHAEAVAEHE